MPVPLGDTVLARYPNNRHSEAIKEAEEQGEAFAVGQARCFMRHPGLPSEEHPEVDILVTPVLQVSELRLKGSEITETVAELGGLAPEPGPSTRRLHGPYSGACYRV